MSLLDENFGIELDLAAIKYDEYKKRLDIFIDKIIEDISNCPLSNTLITQRGGLLDGARLELSVNIKIVRVLKQKFLIVFLHMRVHLTQQYIKGCKK